MSEQEQEVKDESAPKEEPKADIIEDIFETAGRKFNIATPDGRRDLKIWTDALSHLTGKLAQQKGELEKEVEPLRKYNLKSATVDEVSALKKVEQMREEGDHIGADRLMWELYTQQKSETQIIMERERLWNDYKAQNSDVFAVLPEDMAKDYVFRNYQSELADSKDPFELIDRVLKPKAAKFKPKAADPVIDSTPASVLGKGAGSSPATSSVEKKSKESTGSWDKMLDEFGFK